MDSHIWMFLSTVIILLMVNRGSTQTSVCEFSPTTSATFTTMTLKATAELNNAAVVGASPSYTVVGDDIDYMGMEVVKNGGLGPDIQVNFNVDMYDASASPDIVNISFTLTNQDAAALSFVSIEIDLLGYVAARWDVGIPSGAILVGRSFVGYNTTNLASGDSVTFYFLAEPAGDEGTDLPEGNNDFTAELYFTHSGTTYGTFLSSICLLRVTEIEESIIYQQGFTALTFFIMFFAGIAAAILGVWLFLCIRRRRRDATVSPSKSDERRMREKGKKIVMDAKAAMRRGANAIKDFSMVAWDDSIVIILALKDKLHMYREIDNLDILSTINVDTDLETEQNDAAVQASILLVQGLRHNGDISKGVEDKACSTMQTRLKELDKKLEADYKKDLEPVYTDLEAKNKEKLGDLLKRHKEQRQEAFRVVKDMPEIEQKKMMELIDQQQQTEENELTYKLALEQNEEAEKLRKEYAIRKRMGIKEIQQQFIGDVVSGGELNSEKADWLIKQHKQQQEEIHSKYDDEISRQRMSLEEKLARRRALAQASETQEDDHTETLNLIASIQINLIQKLKKTKNLSPDEVEEYMNQARVDLQEVKNKMDKDRDLKQQEMFKRLSQVKRKSLAEKISQHAAELQDYISKSKAQQNDGPVDPVSYVDGLVNLKSRHRKELVALENQIDEAQSKELEVMRDQLAENSKQDLKAVERNLIQKLKTEGMRDVDIDKILISHEKAVNETVAKQLADRKRQELKLKDELARRKREWEERRTREKQEQQDLREHEAEIVDKLLGSQVSISEAERDRILKEHEKQMVKLENSLTLNKLKQKRMLEEKIALRRARQMEELEQKQNAELMKQRKVAENNGEEDDEDFHQKEMTTMKKHAEQRMALIQGVDFNIDEELDEIRLEMTKERALALKDQEERLGAFITSLQMDKAREMSKIEEQQKAINNLKANLMDDLNSRGILSTPECERILSVHKEQQDNLHQRLDSQRAKQEKLLRAKLQERLQVREKTMLQKQDSEMREMLEKATNKTSAKIRKMILIHKQMVQMEKFKNKMGREISQSLENTKRDFELQKQTYVQDQEMQFIAGLVQVGQFDRNELLDVLHMLYPGKTEEAITDILNKIYDEKHGSRDKQQQSQSTLAQRIYTAQYSNPTPLHRRGSVMSLTTKGGSASRPLSKRGSKLSMTSFKDDSIRSKNKKGFQESFSRSSSRNQFGPQDDYTRPSSRNQFGPQDDYGRKLMQNGDFDEEDEYVTKRNRPMSGHKKSYQQSYDYDEEDVYRSSRGGQYNDYEDDDYIGQGLAQQGSNYSGRLPPLKNEEQPTGRKKKKKLLKKLAHHGSDDDML